MDLISKLGFSNLNNILFFKFWIKGNIEDFQKIYDISPLPGNKEGISGSTVTGYNIGIYKKIDSKKKDAAIKVFKYIISKEFQKKSFISDQIVSVMSSLYEDKEVCKIKDCEFYKSHQLISKPINGIEDFDEYDLKYRENILKFLYGNKTAKETLKKINDISKIYFFTIHTENTSIGLICFIVITFFIIIILLSLIFLFMEKFSPYFNFLPQDFWIILIFGLVLILSSCYASFEELTKTKCYLRYSLQSFGIMLFLTIILYQLIVNFPEKNKNVEWITNHRYQFLLFFLLIEIIPKIIIYINTFEIQDVIITNGQNFQICYLKNVFSIFLEIFKFFYMIIIIIVICILIYAEWNIKSTFYEVRLIIFSIYVDIISLILIIILQIVIIKNYLLYNILQDILVLIIAIFNYMLIYGSKILLGIINKENPQSKIINKIVKNFIDNNSTNSRVTSSQSNNTSNIISSNNCDTILDSSKVSRKRNSIITKIMYFHTINEFNEDNDSNTNN